MYTLEVSIVAEGVWAWLAANPTAVAFARLQTVYRKAHKLALTEFMGGGIGTHSIRSRFSQSYGAKITQRSETYIKRVKKFYGGRYLPFRSPTREGAGKTGHMAELVRVPETGYRLQSKNGTNLVLTQLFLPGARVLNFRPVYRKDFLSLDRLNRDDAAAIEARVNEIAIDALRNEINRAKRRTIKAARGAA